MIAWLDDSGGAIEGGDAGLYWMPEAEADALWPAPGGGVHLEPLLFAGYLPDGEAGPYLVRNRACHVGLGRWSQRDPAGFVGGMNAYPYVRANRRSTPCPAGDWECRKFGGGRPTTTHLGLTRAI